MFSPSPSITERDILNKILVPGLNEDVEKLNNTYESVKAELSVAERRPLTDDAVRVWVERLRDIFYEIEDALDVWNTVLLKKRISEDTRGSNYYALSDCSWLKLVREGNFPSRIIKLNEKLDAYSFTSKPVAAALPSPPRRESSSFIKASTVCGRDLEIQRLVGNLCNSSQQKGGLEVISVVGMGGVGKTTLAQRVYNDADVKSHFHTRIWACVSDPFDEVQVCKTVANSLRDDPIKFTNLQKILEYINGSIAEKRYLLVLDDVWTEDSSHWESLLSSLDSGADGSKILVTTRIAKCARAIGSTSVHPLGQLSPDDSWKLFSQIAFFNKSDEDVENLKEVGQKIAEKCKGLPLAIKALASHLQYKNNTEREWQRVLESEIWELETAEKRIFKPLLLSYYDLPSLIKRCFSFCATFPKDYEFKVTKLIRLWMSQGYLNNSRNEDMETVGEEYFQHLVTRSFFQDLEFEKDLATISSCKMHDIVHDFAQFLSKDESLIIDNKKPGLLSCEKLRHLTVLNVIYSREDVMSSNFSSIIQQRLHLHTLRIPRSSIIRKRGMMNFLQNLSQHLCFVKALDLRFNEIVEFPEEIGQLVHLRYLDLSENRELKRLPGTIYELCNLQTLLLDGCESLRALPKGIEKLINLRHLEIGHHLTVLPKGIGSVSSLRTLDVFNVGRDEGYGGEVGAGAATIGDLGNLNNLQGFLGISQLKNVKDGREASKAELRNKKGLTGLGLYFGEGVGIKGRHDQEVIEALEPPCHNLEILFIDFYSGKLLPRWIASSSLTKLRKLFLWECRECEGLPPLGQLPSLEKLRISSMNSCKRIGEEFLGMKRSGGGRDGKKMTTTSSIAVAFPKLKKLVFGFMKEWREWEDILSTGDDDDNDDLIHFKLFPCLDKVKIWGCGQLKSLPQFISKSPIQFLEIRNCPILEGRCRGETGEDWSKISHIPNIRVVNGQANYRITVFEIKDGQLQRLDTKSEVGAVVATIGDLGNLNNFHGRLRITHLKNVKDGREASKAELRNKIGLVSLIFDFEDGVGIEGHEEEVIEALEPPCHSLENLEIYEYSGKLLPRWIASSSLTKLRVLVLSSCWKCEELPPLGQLPSLEKLDIWFMNSCKRIGEEFLGMKRSGGRRDGKKMTMTSSIAVAFPKLKELVFGSMEEWREWEDILITGDNDDDLIHFKLFPCLDKLEIWFCGKLKSLPQFISKSPIKTLEICNCPILEGRCRPETGEDWSKIFHIPNIKALNTRADYDSDTSVFEIKDGQLQGT